MKKVIIYTLNIGGFKNGELYELEKIVGRLLVHEGIIIVLQEVPHQDRVLNYKSQPCGWEDNPSFLEFKKAFEDYKVIFPGHLIDSKSCTVAICRKDGDWNIISNEKISYGKHNSYGNKLVEVEHSGGTTLLGLHMNPTDKMWDLGLNSEKKNRHTFIAGDFNAYEFRGKMQKKPDDLRNLGFCPLISSNVITYFDGNSSIDNVYVSRSFDFKSGIAVKVENIGESFKTDHALCSVEFDV